MMCHLPGKFSPSFTPPPPSWGGGVKMLPGGLNIFGEILFTGATASKKYIFSQNFIGGSFEDFLSKILGVQKCP